MLGGASLSKAPHREPQEPPVEPPGQEVGSRACPWTQHPSSSGANSTAAAGGVCRLTGERVNGAQHPQPVLSEPPPTRATTSFGTSCKCWHSSAAAKGKIKLTEKPPQTPKRNQESSLFQNQGIFQFLDSLLPSLRPSPFPRQGFQTLCIVSEVCAEPKTPVGAVDGHESGTAFVRFTCKGKSHHRDVPMFTCPALSSHTVCSNPQHSGEPGAALSPHRLACSPAVPSLSPCHPSSASLTFENAKLRLL